MKVYFHSLLREEGGGEGGKEEGSFLFLFTFYLAGATQGACCGFLRGEITLK